MTFEILTKLMEEHNIPKDVELLSDSGWECGETEMGGVYYNRVLNKLIFTQEGKQHDRWFKKKHWELIYGEHKLCSTCANFKKYAECIEDKDEDYCERYSEKIIDDSTSNKISGFSDDDLFSVLVCGAEPEEPYDKLDYAKEWKKRSDEGTIKNNYGYSILLGPNRDYVIR